MIDDDRKKSLDESLLIDKPHHKKMKSEYKILDESSEYSKKIITNEVKMDFEKIPRQQTVYKSYKNITTMIEKKRGSKYTETNICKELKKVLKENQFMDYIEHYTFLKIQKNVLEKIAILEFRNIKVDSTFDDQILTNNIIEGDDEPIRINNRKIMWFIVILVLIFIGAILFIFLKP